MIVLQKPRTMYPTTWGDYPGFPEEQRPVLLLVVQSCCYEIKIYSIVYVR